MRKIMILLPLIVDTTFHVVHTIRSHFLVSTFYLAKLVWNIFALDEISFRREINIPMSAKTT